MGSNAWGQDGNQTLEEQGQYVFDVAFWQIIYCFTLGTFAGLFIKLTNRS